MHKLFSRSSTPINYHTELIGGLTNFMAIAYIIVLNPMIMHANGLGFPTNATMTTTLVIIIIMTILASFIIKLPFVIAPGIGVSVMVSYTIVVHDKLPLDIALGVIFWSGILLFVFSITPLRQKIIDAIPEHLQLALSVGIGLFLIMIGLKNADIIISNPNTLISMSKFNLNTGLCFIGFILACVLFIKKKTYAMLLPIIIVTIFNLALGKSRLPTNIFDVPDFSLFMHIDFIHSLKLSILPAILSLFLINFFDATSSVVGLLSQLDHQDKNIKNIYYKRALNTDGISGVLSGLIGNAPGVIFIESSIGIQNGAKTGFASLITALICIPFLFISPLVNIIPSNATSPILILVGILMMNNLRKIKFIHLEEFISVILTVIMMPLCFSITAGAIFGIISYVVLKLLLGKHKDLSISLIIVAICCAGWFAL